MSERHFEKSWEATDKVGRGPNIPDDWKRYIMQEAIVQSHKPRMLLADEILEQMRQSRDIKDRLPEKESIAKLISKVRNHLESPLDEPWSLSSLVDYEIPPEALPAVMSAYKKRLKDNQLTIREALWIGRLYSVIEPKDLVYDWASIYAVEEMINELSGKSFDSSKLDREMIKDVYLPRKTVKIGEIMKVLTPLNSLPRI